MKTQSVLINNVRSKTYKRFSLWCKKRKKNIGPTLSEVLEDFLKEHGGKR